MNSSLSILGKKTAIVVLVFLTFLQSLALAGEESYRPWDHMWYGTRDIPDTQNAWIAGLGTAATLATLVADHRVKDYFSATHRLGAATDIGDFWGSGIPGVGIGVLALGYGLVFKHPYEVESGEAHLEALAANLIYTNILKYSIRRPRPDTQTRTSFPSGHSSTAFTTAGSLMDMYGPWAGVPALAMGALTAVSRLDANRHWLSDTVFGATLGLVVGHAYSRHHKETTKPTQAIVYPYYESHDDFGLAAKFGF